MGDFFGSIFSKPKGIACPDSISAHFNGIVNQVEKSSGIKRPKYWLVMLIPGTKVGDPGWQWQVSGTWICGNTDGDRNKMTTYLGTDPQGNVTDPVLWHEIVQGFQFCKFGASTAHLSWMIQFMPPQYRQYWR